MCKDIKEHVQEAYPEIVSPTGKFQYRIAFDISFINPFFDLSDGEGVANDFTNLSASSLDDLEKQYREFCEEKNIPCDTVTYVQIDEAGTWLINR